MQTLDRFLIRPRFRDGVRVVRGAGATAIEYRAQSCDVEHGAEAAGDVGRFLDALIAGATPEALLTAYATLPVGDLLAELDKLGVLTDSAFDTPEVITGSELHAAVIALASDWSTRTCRSRFHDALVEGEATREHLIRYAIEYYHIVRASVGLIAPALGHVCSDRTRRLLTDFVRSEMGHDVLMYDSLAAVGISRSDVHRWIPLPSTFALCSTLSVLAAQDPLSFKCALFLFEQPSDTFTGAFVARARELAMPEAFWIPMVRHASINDEGAHGDITAELLADVPAVSHEEALVAKKHVAVLIETMALLEDQILDGGELALSPHRWTCLSGAAVQP